MKNKLVRILITIQNMKLANRILWKIRETLPNTKYSIQSLIHTEINPAKDLVERGLVDILVTGINFSDGTGEELITLAIKLNSKMPIIIFLDIKDDKYELDLRRKYRKNIDCIVGSEWFKTLDTALIDAYHEASRFKSRQIVFPNLIFSVDQTCYITADSDYIKATIYDFETQTFCTIDKKMSMKGFMAEYNKKDDFVRCHASWIVNKRMIKQVFKAHQYLVLVINDENGEEIQIPISHTYRKDVLYQLKGMY